MGPKHKSNSNLEEINKQIIEIKKKIQLAEGKRKAAFEEYETERKQNADTILKLKKEIKELTIALQKNRDESAAHRIKCSNLEEIVGPLHTKTTDQVLETLDLHIIDLRKNLDLIKHKIKERQKYLTKVAKEYQQLLSQKPKEEVVTKLLNTFEKKSGKKCKEKSEEKKPKTADSEIASPYRKKCSEIQNNIHRIEVQWREAEHVKNSYRAIKSSLIQDRGYFESALKHLEEKEEAQQKEIADLQRMNAEAASTRSQARLALDREERASLHSSRIRERQAAEQHALVAAQRQELERLERQIFQSGKTGAVPGSGSPGSGMGTGEEPSEAIGSGGASRPGTGNGERDTPEEKVDVEKVIREAFDKLKNATGASSSNDVLSKFKTQQETQNRLEYLKKTTEEEKRQLELKQEALHDELERYKYAHERDKEKFGDEIISLQKNIETQIEHQLEIKEKIQERQSLLEEICKLLYKLYISLKEVGVKPSKDITANPDHARVLVKTLYIELEDIVRRNEELKGEEDENNETAEEIASEDDMLPTTYNALLRRTPLPVQGHPIQMSTPLPSGPEDEEEVPSRSFLKRQAQIVVDAKSRRKAIRIPLRK